MNILEMALSRFQAEAKETRRLLERIIERRPEWNSFGVTESLLEIIGNVSQLPAQIVSPASPEAHPGDESLSALDASEVLEVFHLGVRYVAKELQMLVHERAISFRDENGDHIVYTMSDLKTIRLNALDLMTFYRGQLTAYLQFLDSEVCNVINGEKTGPPVS